MPDAREFVTPVPPLAEQNTIVQDVQAKVKRADQTNDAVRIQVDRLREYRQALISAAVTGKIDVTKETT